MSRSEKFNQWANLMKKNMIIGIILGVILLLLAFGLFNAKKLQHIEITSTVSIAAQKENVYQLISRLENYPKWSPFLAQDPSQKYEVKGTDGQIGAQYHWNGNKGKDLGYQEIIKLEPATSIEIKCFIQKPFTASPNFTYELKETAEGTKVTQVFKLESGLIDAFFLGLFGVKKEMKQTNQQGLALLKKIAESS